MAEITSMNVTVNVQTPPDVDGDTVHNRKRVDVWGNLTATQQGQVQRIYNALVGGLKTRYGESLVLEGVSFGTLE